MHIALSPVPPWRSIAPEGFAAIREYPEFRLCAFVLDARNAASSARPIPLAHPVDACTSCVLVAAANVAVHDLSQSMAKIVG